MVKKPHKRKRYKLFKSIQEYLRHWKTFSMTRERYIRCENTSEFANSEFECSVAMMARERFDELIRGIEGARYTEVSTETKIESKHGNKITLIAKILTKKEWEEALDLVPLLEPGEDGRLFEITMELELENVSIPVCYHPNYTETITENRNHIDVNLDTIGTSLGIRAKGISVVYIEEMRCYGLVWSTYWCM